MHLIKLLVDKTLGERGFSGTGRLITRVLNTLSNTYPINGRYVNEDEWSSPGRIPLSIGKVSY
jgi:proteasome activator subunit 4